MVAGSTGFGDLSPSLVEASQQNSFPTQQMPRYEHFKDKTVGELWAAVKTAATSLDPKAESQGPKQSEVSEPLPLLEPPKVAIGSMDATSELINISREDSVSPVKSSSSQSRFFTL